MRATGMAIFCLILLSFPAHSSSPAVIDRVPPTPIDEGTPSVRAHHIWAAGSWKLNKGRLVWFPGHWIAKRPGYNWVPDGWHQSGNKYYYTEGFWVKNTSDVEDKTSSVNDEAPGSHTAMPDEILQRTAQAVQADIAEKNEPQAAEDTYIDTDNVKIALRKEVRKKPLPAKKIIFSAPNYRDRRIWPRVTQH